MCILISCEGGGEQLLDLRAGQEEEGFSSFSPPTPIFSEASVDHAGRWAATQLARRLSAPLIENRYAAALVDVRRSLHHRQLFGNDVKNLDGEVKQRLIDRVYQPYREQIRQQISGMLLGQSLVIHLSVRSFDAKNSKGDYQRTDVGLLYDPSHTDEVDFCLDWIDEMYDEAPNLKVRRNYPSRGTNDSLTRSMRVEYSGKPYVGVEVWVNRSWAQRPSSRRNEAIEGMAWALRSLTENVAANAA